MINDPADIKIFCSLKAKRCKWDYPVYEHQVIEWEQAFPGLQVRAILWGLKDLLLEEPRYRRALKDMPAFIEEHLRHWQEGPYEGI